MLISMKKIPVTADSYPFITAAKACDLERYGYVEFFQSGTANVYDEDAEGLRVITKDAPYTTRRATRRSTGRTPRRNAPVRSKTSLISVRNMSWACSGT